MRKEENNQGKEGYLGNTVIGVHFVTNSRLLGGETKPT